MSRRAPIVLFVVALAGAGALLLALASQLTFVGDGWELLAGRPDWTPGTFFQPFNEHPVVLPALTYKILLALFGMNSAMPFYGVSVSLFLLSAVLLFAYLRRRVGDWSALAGAVLVLFLGAAYEDLLWEFQLCFFGSMSAGLGALLALDRGDRRGDLIASLLLVVSVAFSGLGIPFIAAAGADVALDRKSSLRRAFVPLLPLLAYALWWLIAGHSTGGAMELAHVPDLPRYVFDAVAAGVASLLGRQPIEADGHPPLLAQALAVLLAVVLACWAGRRRHVPPGLIVALVLAFTFWALLGLDRGPQRFSSRFQYPSAVFLLIIVAEALRGKRPSRPTALALAAITLGAAIGGVSLLHKGYADRWKPTSDQIRATLAAIDLAGAHAQASYSMSLPPSIFLPVGQYRLAMREHGTPAFTEPQLLAAGESPRQAADRALAAAINLRLVQPTRWGPGYDCTLTSPASPAVQLAATGRFMLENRSGGRAAVAAGRFSHSAPARLGSLPAHSTRILSLPRDRAEQPWHLEIDAAPIRLCRAG
ncbi:MAG TPA: hypothetical protein VF125_01960 [Solirubrobacterales bacterium]